MDLTIQSSNKQDVAQSFFKQCDELIEELENELDSDNIGAQKRYNIQQRLFKLNEHKEGLYKAYYHIK
jgi:frataxin-like iron-binding protein CyaY